MDNFKEMIELNKPAHLTYEIKYRYRTWGELSSYKWEELEPFTWDEIYQKAEIK